jgi:hypothetical protein
MYHFEHDLDDAPSPALDRDSSVRRFFARYEAALASCDSYELSQMWSAPAFVIGDDGANAIGSVHEVERFFDGTRRERDALGISGTRADVVRIEWPTEHIAVVDVRFPYRTNEGAEVGEELSRFVLLREPSGAFKLRMALLRGAYGPA